MNIPKDQLRLIYILVILCIVGMCAGCTPRVISVTPANDSLYGKPLYHVRFSNNTVLEYMYYEEIKASKRTSKWAYNEDLIIKH